jgi:hypothetical protein
MYFNASRKADHRENYIVSGTLPSKQTALFGTKGLQHPAAKISEVARQ